MLGVSVSSWFPPMNTPNGCGWLYVCFGSLKVALTVKSPLAAFLGFQKIAAGPVVTLNPLPSSANFESATVNPGLLPPAAFPCHPLAVTPPPATLRSASCCRAAVDAEMSNPAVIPTNTNLPRRISSSSTGWQLSRDGPPWTGFRPRHSTSDASPLHTARLSEKCANLGAPQTV